MNPFALSGAAKALIIAAFLAFGAFWCVHFGEGLESDRRDAIELKRTQQAQQSYARAMDLARVNEQKYLAAMLRTGAAETNIIWRIDHATERELAVTNGACAQEAVDRKDAVLPACVVTRYFVRLWDGARAPDIGAEPVPGDPGGSSPEEREATALGPRDLLRNEQANAATCVADRLRLDALIDTIGDLEAQWDRGHR